VHINSGCFVHVLSVHSPSVCCCNSARSVVCVATPCAVIICAWRLPRSTPAVRRAQKRENKGDIVRGAYYYYYLIILKNINVEDFRFITLSSLNSYPCDDINLLKPSGNFTYDQV
jgi:hypothetical protein